MALPALVSAAKRAFRTPPVAVSVAGTFAVVIALNTAVFAVIDAVWLNPLPFAEPDRLVAIGRVPIAGSSTRPGPVSIPEFLDWTDRSLELDGLAAVAYETVTVDDAAGARTIDVAAVTPNLFAVLGANAAIGRVFGPNDVSHVPSDVVVLGHAFWNNVFHGDADVIGKSLRLSRFDVTRNYEVIGVLPKDVQIQYPKPHDAYIPLAQVPVDRAGMARLAAAYTVFGRMRPGLSLGSVRNAMQQLGEVLNREYPTSRLNTKVEIMALDEFWFGRTRPLLVALAAAAGIILILACANVSAILLSATLDRTGELATRTALGAGRWQLTSMLLAEHAFLGLVGAVTGLALASASLGVLRHIAPPDLPRIETIAINWTVIVLSLAVSALATLASALFPAWRFGRLNPADELRSGGRTFDVGTRRAQHMLLAGQIALVTVLLLGAGVIVGSLRDLLRVELGFRPEGVVGLRARFLVENYGPRGVSLQDRITREVLTRPGVASAGWTSEVPLGAPNSVYLRLRHLDHINPRYRIVSAGYLETIGASVIRGRLFEHRDRDAKLAVVNRSFAQKYFQGRNPVGDEVFIRDWHQIIGVIGDVREGRLEDPDTPTIYWQFSGENWMAGFPWLIVRMQDAKRANPDALRAVVASVDPALPVAATERLADRVAHQTSRTRFLSAVLSGIGGVALLIAAGGIYGLTSYSVRRRRQELGLRMALGANRGAVAWQVLRGLATVTALGILAGLALGGTANQWLRAFMFGIDPADGAVSVTAVMTIVAMSLASCSIPLRRALSIEPADALRRE